jgi:hypothetical protein
VAMCKSANKKCAARDFTRARAHTHTHTHINMKHPGTRLNFDNLSGYNVVKKDSAA